MKTYIQHAKEYCKTLKNHSVAYKEAMIYAAFGGQIGINKCAKIAVNI